MVSLWSIFRLYTFVILCSCLKLSTYCSVQHFGFLRLFVYLHLVHAEGFAPQCLYFADALSKQSAATLANLLLNSKVWGVLCTRPKTGEFSYWHGQWYRQVGKHSCHFTELFLTHSCLSKATARLFAGNCCYQNDNKMCTVPHVESVHSSTTNFIPFLPHRWYQPILHFFFQGVHPEEVVLEKAFLKDRSSGNV